MNLKKSALATALAGALALGAAGQASASIYASSRLLIDDLTILITEDGINQSPGVTITTFEFTATNTARLNGVDDLSPGRSADCGGLPGPGNNDCGLAPVLDPLAANAPGGTVDRANNDFSLFGPGADTYANSDSLIDTAELVNLGVPTTTRQIAEAELQDTGSARANAELTSNTGFTFAFDLDGAEANTLILDFMATPYMRAYIDQLGFTSGSAQANMNVSFTLTRATASGGGSVTWSPDGTCDVNGALIGDGVTCSVDNAAFTLNQNPTVSVNPDDIVFNPGQGQFGITVGSLRNGSYTLALNTLTSVSVRQTVQVPEPGSLALLGLGLAGLGFVSRRRNRAGRG